MPKPYGRFEMTRTAMETSYRLEDTATWPTFKFSKGTDGAAVTMTVWELDRFEKGGRVRDEPGGGKDDPLIAFRGTLYKKEKGKGFWFLPGAAERFPLKYPGPKFSFYFEGKGGEKVKNEPFEIGSVDDKEFGTWELGWSIQEGSVPLDEVRSRGPSSRVPLFVEIKGAGTYANPITDPRQECINLLGQLRDDVGQVYDEEGAYNWLEHGSAAVRCYKAAYESVKQALEDQAHHDEEIAALGFTVIGFVVGLASGGVGGYLAKRWAPALRHRGTKYFEWAFGDFYDYLEKGYEKRKSLIGKVSKYSEKLSKWGVGELEHRASGGPELPKMDEPLNVSNHIKDLVAELFNRIREPIVAMKNAFLESDPREVDLEDLREVQAFVAKTRAEVKGPKKFSETTMREKMARDLWAIWLKDWLKRPDVQALRAIPGKYIWKAMYELGIQKEAKVVTDDMVKKFKNMGALELLESYDANSFDLGAMSSDERKDMHWKFSSWASSRSQVLCRSYDKYIFDD